MPEVTEMDWPVEPEHVRTDSAARKKVTAAYRRQVVRPAIHDYAVALYRLHDGPRQLGPARDEWDFVSLQEGMACPGGLLMGLENTPAERMCHRLWAVVRVTQAPPLPVWGKGAGVLTLAHALDVVMDCVHADAVQHRATGKSRPPTP